MRFRGSLEVRGEEGGTGGGITGLFLNECFVLGCHSHCVAE